MVARLNRQLGYLLLLSLLGSILYITFETATPMTWGDPDDTGFTATSAGCTANTSPDANPGVTYTGIEGSPIAFDGSASSDPDGDNLTYSWSFGDNTTGPGRQILHTYRQEGTYCVALTVIDSHGACDRGYVRAIIQDSQPIANFSASAHKGVAPLTVNFTDTSRSHDGIQTWLWNFGDNSTSQDAAPSHAFQLPGAYPITLTVTEADQDQDTTDPILWINVTETSVTDSKRRPPTLTIIDATSATYPGSPATYTFAITNNDPQAFTTSTFAFESRLPANWTATYTPSDATLTPGTNQTVTMIVTPDPSTQPQRYNLTLTVWSIEVPTLQVTDTLSLLILNASTRRVPPSLTLTSELQVGVQGEAVVYLLMIRNNDPPSVNASVFTLDAQLPTEWIGTFNVTSLTLSSNTSTIVAFTVTSPSTASSDDYNFTLRVTNPADPDLTSHITGIYRIPVADADNSTDDATSDNTTEPASDESPSQNLTLHLIPENPTADDRITFTITTPSDNDTIIRIYMDDALIHQNIATGNYTYQAGPFAEGNHTYYLEAEDNDGTLIRDPPNGTKLLSIDPPSIGLPTIPWYLFLLPILALILLNGVSQYINSKGAQTTPSQPPPTPTTSPPTTPTDSNSTDSDANTARVDIQ